MNKKYLVAAVQAAVLGGAIAVLDGATMNISHAKNVLDWSPRISFEEGLDRTFAKGALRAGVI